MYLACVKFDLAGAILLPHTHLGVGAVSRLLKLLPHTNVFEKLLRLRRKCHYSRVELRGLFSIIQRIARLTNRRGRGTS